ncbi:MAG TPA: ATP-binding protein [Burkholderiaceae bacterium]|nr:ATP-binding protein [Burkholderiaceae bacterium]
MLIGVLAGGLGMSVYACATLLLGPQHPFLFVYPTLALVMLTVGVGSGLVTALTCMVWIVVPWLPPDETLMPLGGLSMPAAATFGVGVLALSAVVRRRQAQPRGRPVFELDSDAAGRVHLVVVVMAIALPLAVFAAAARYTYAQAFQGAEQRADRAIRIVQEHAAKILDANGALAGRALDALGEERADALRDREAELHRRLGATVRGMPQVQSIWIYDERGRTVATNRFFPAPRDLDVSDRPYFRWHVENRGGLYVGEPTVGRATKEVFVNTSLRRDLADGRFGGVVSVSLDPNYFSAFYSELAADEPGLTLTLIRTDGTVIARWPEPPRVGFRLAADSELMRRIAAGERSGLSRANRSRIDGTVRVLAFRGLESYPLYVGAGIPHEAVLAAWRRDMSWLALALFSMASVLVGSAWYAMRRARREREALLRLQHETRSRARAETALLQTQKLEALGLLTGSVAHDFNNLLAVVNNNAHLIERLPDGRDPRPLVAAIRRAVNTGTQLTRQLLSFSRRQPLRPVDADPAEVLAAIRELLQTTVGRHIAVSLHVAADVPRITVDLAELELALINLALNARDAMPDGGRLAILAREAGAEERPAGSSGRWIVLSVSDSGSGMTDEVRERAFEPFFTTKVEGKGTGLGLAQVASMCEQAGGITRIDSSAGEGTTVTLVLPASTREAAVAPEAAPRGVDALPCEVLLVEDNLELAATTRSLLESFGARVVHAPSADAALETVAARAEPFDVVLSDIMMPGSMNGLALARHLRRRSPTLPIVLMTGYAAEIHGALAAGFEVLPKPCVPETLAAALAGAMGRTTAEPAGAAAPRERHRSS